MNRERELRQAKMRALRAKLGLLAAIEDIGPALGEAELQRLRAVAYEAVGYPDHLREALTYCEVEEQREAERERKANDVSSLPPADGPCGYMATVSFGRWTEFKDCSLRAKYLTTRPDGRPVPACTTHAKVFLRGNAPLVRKEYR